ncbi:MAG: hypothetical protein EKK53_09865 [Burkholderiales bacterium]|nr:MAG: hypothetical protein EKK53_09865 [Burkholderiales bacterium]
MFVSIQGASVRRYVKVLAAGTLMGTQALPGYVSVVDAQNSQLASVTVTGKSNGGSSNGGSACWPNCTAYSGGGGNSSGGGGSVPEAEAFGRAPAPPHPKKTPQEREEQKRRCEGTYKQDMDNLTAEVNARFTACANSATTPIGVVVDRLLGQASAQSCISTVARYRDDKQWDINLKRAQCLVEADKP